MRYLLAFLVSAFLGAGTCLAEDPVLRFSVSGQTLREVTLSEMKQQVDVEEVHIYNPFMSKDKSYLALPIAALLDSVYAGQWKSSDYSDIAFTALDGYEAISPLETLQQAGGYLAFEDLGWENGWEPIGRNLSDPGPYFLIWSGRDQTTANEFPWPWQVAEINLLRFADQYPAVIPEDVTVDSAVYQGFETFRYRCLRCHSLDQQGGKIGPDLNAPQSIVAYRSEEMIKAFIKQPSQFRYSHMPDHTDLTDMQLDELYQYLTHQMNR